MSRSAGIVHQGGIGSTFKALRAGIPQVIVPVNFDQPYNAMCVQTLGVGVMLSVEEYKPDRVPRRWGAAAVESSSGAMPVLRGENPAMMVLRKPAR
jgi:hypothetical protein